MPIIKSAKKRVKIAAKATALNSKTKRVMREAVKAFYTALNSGKDDKIKETFGKAVSAIDVAAKKNVIHKNKAARKKSQLSATLKSASTKPVVKKVAPKKTTASRKTPAKKAAAKKAPVKKSTPKKAAK